MAKTEFGPDCVKPSTYVGGDLGRAPVDPHILGPKPMVGPGQRTLAEIGADNSGQPSPAKRGS
jgi:hypothetical protein